MSAIPLLYAASHYTTGRSLLSPKKIVALAKTSGVASLCDDQALAGAYELSLEAKKKGLKAVLGTRLVLDDLEIAVHIEDAPGWPALCRISNELRLKQFNLAQLIAALAAAPLFISIDAGCPAATAWAATDHEAIAALIAGLPADRLAFAIARSAGGLQGRAVARKAASLSIPSIAAPIPVVAESVDTDIINILGEDQKPRWPVAHYLSDGEIRELYADLPGATDNAIALATRCNFALTQNKPSMPTFKGVDEKATLRTVSAQGLEKRLSEHGISDRAAYDARYAMEIEIIIKLGFAGYFLIVADFVNAAKASGIPVGPGRGSGAGSLIAWCLGITDLDPIELGLFFERFINPSRVSPPDSDIDFCERRRDRVVAYIVDRYGLDHVAQIGAWQTLQPKAAWRTAGRALGLTPGQQKRIADLIPDKVDSLEAALTESPALREALGSDVECAEAMQSAIKIEGVVAHKTRHPAGVVLADDPLESITPLSDNEGAPAGIPATQFDMKSIDNQGLLKFDLLGLKTLTIIDRARELAAKTGAIFDPWKTPYEDATVFDMLRQGWTINVFQLESTGMKRAISRVGISSFEDIVALISLYRPGPMDQIPIYAARKKGYAPIAYPHPALAAVLHSTYGIPIYQEQIMDLARRLAGYSLAEADLLRRAMGKKIPEEMAALEKSFIEGCVANATLEPRMTEAQARDIFAMVAKFAGYGFNRSHAAAYARITSVTAWLKAHHYQAYMAACMDQDANSTGRLEIDVAEIRRLGVPITPADVNLSGELFDITLETNGEANSIVYALSGIKGVGHDVARAIRLEREANGPFFDFVEFRKRMSAVVKKHTMELLIRAGAFDTLDATIPPETSRQLYLTELESGDAPSGPQLFAASPHVRGITPLTRAEMAAMEASAYGFSLTRHPTDQFAHLVDNVRVHTLAAAGKASKTVSTEALAVFAQIEEQDSRIAVVLDDGQTTLRAVMKGGLLPPPPTRDGPGVYVVRIGAQRTILEWTPAAAYSARKLARAKAKVA